MEISIPDYCYCRSRQSLTVSSFARGRSILAAHEEEMVKRLFIAMQFA
jgi:hypothetical protein